MAERVQVECIRKLPDHYDPHVRIQAIGGLHGGARWFVPTDRAIEQIEQGAYEYYVLGLGLLAPPVDVIVAVHNDRKYLKTTADAYEPNNLLALPECPKS